MGAASLFVEGGTSQPRLIYLVPAYTLSLILISWLYVGGDETIVSFLIDDGYAGIVVVSLTASILFVVLYYLRPAELLAERWLRFVNRMAFEARALPLNPFAGEEEIGISRRERIARRFCWWRKRKSLWGYDDNVLVLRAPATGEVRSRFFGSLYFEVSLFGFLLCRHVLSPMHFLTSIEEKFFFGDWNLLWAWLGVTAISTFSLWYSFKETMRAGRTVAGYYYCYRRIKKSQDATNKAFTRLIDSIVARDWDRARSDLDYIWGKHHDEIVRTMLDRYISYTRRGGEIKDGIRRQILEIIKEPILTKDGTIHVDTKKLAFKALRKISTEQDKENLINWLLEIRQELADGLEVEWVNTLCRFEDEEVTEALKKAMGRVARYIADIGWGWDEESGKSTIVRGDLIDTVLTRMVKLRQEETLMSFVKGGYLGLPAKTYIMSKLARFPSRNKDHILWFLNREEVWEGVVDELLGKALGEADEPTTPVEIVDFFQREVERMRHSRAEGAALALGYVKNEGATGRICSLVLGEDLHDSDRQLTVRNLLKALTQRDELELIGPKAIERMEELATMKPYLTEARSILRSRIILGG